MRREICEVVRDKWVASPAIVVSLNERVLISAAKRNITRRQQANRIAAAKGRPVRQAINFLTISIPSERAARNVNTGTGSTYARIRTSEKREKSLRRRIYK